MSRRHIPTPTPRLNYNSNKKSHNPKRTTEQPRWRATPTTKAAPPPHHNQTSKIYFLDLIERGDVSSFTFCWAYIRQHEDALFDAVPPLSHLCMRNVTLSEKTFRSQVARLTADDYLPTEMRNSITSTALAKGYLTTQREMRRLVLHADTEELDFSHANCRELINDAFLRHFFPHVPIVKEVDSWEEITTADLYRSPQGCPRLVRLSLAACWNISAQLIRDVLKSFAHLSVLDLSGMPVDLLKDIRFESQSLTQLVLARIRGTRSTFPLCFTLATPSLRFLSLRDTPYVGRIQCEAGPASGGTTSGLLLKRSSRGDAAAAAAAAAPQGLQALDMSGVRLLAFGTLEESLLNLCRLHAATLKVLNLANCDVKPHVLTRITSLAVSEHASPATSVHGLQLEEVSLANNKNLSSESILAFVHTFCHSLKLLDISRCDVHAVRISDLARSLQPSPGFVALRT